MQVDWNMVVYGVVIGLTIIGGLFIFSFIADKISSWKYNRKKQAEELTNLRDEVERLRKRSCC